ncbi:xanthine dehydrogenase family protein subunit M [Tropicibacter sp. Alg240-R139]|uniref:FAD binding domain-containing protein n=1 Tax=Tropicibacter sp. Alg240-R139 TaxID=2305991 RepID=UPI001966D136|nr:FAD binding domain-containing protein [Tropicibacter sp. Alg240-R139]
MARFQLGIRTLDYISPTTLDDAFDRLSARNVDIIAGGTDFYPTRPQGPLNSDLLDVTRIAGLRGITQTRNGWRIGATTRWSEVFRADLPAAFAGLQSAAREVGSLQIQNAGTIAGNLCNASPAADGVPPLLTLDAQVEIGSTRGIRMVALSDFIMGVRKTDLHSDELVTAIVLPEPPAHAHSAFEKLGSRRYLVISITMTATVIGLDTDGRIDHARVAVGACSPVAQRLTALECDLLGKTLDQVEITEAHLASLSPIDDVRGSGDYRLDAVAEQCLRAIKQAGGGNG